MSESEDEEDEEEERNCKWVDKTVCYRWCPIIICPAKPQKKLPITSTGITRISPKKRKQCTEEGAKDGEAIDL